MKERLALVYRTSICSAKLVECASAIKDGKGIMGTSNKKVFTFSYQTGSGEANAALEAGRCHYE